MVEEGSGAQETAHAASRCELIAVLPLVLARHVVRNQRVVDWTDDLIRDYFAEAPDDPGDVLDLLIVTGMLPASVLIFVMIAVAWAGETLGGDTGFRISLGVSAAVVVCVWAFLIALGFRRLAHYVSSRPTRRLRVAGCLDAAFAIVTGITVGLGMGLL